MKNVLWQLSTHWDREWYLPFQGFRYALVNMMDTLLDALDSGRIPGFVLDGQTVVLEDYLEIRPEMRAAMEKHIRADKLRVGPWYGMPDEFLVSGESLIENFLVGQKVARDFGGEPWRFGYVNDVFGHVAQFPQILRGFGMTGAYLGRGVDTSFPHGSFFLWRAPDGSECYVYKDNYTRVKAAMDKAEDKQAAFRAELAKNPAAYPAVLNYTNDHAVIDENTDRFLEALTQSEGAGECAIVGDMENLATQLTPIRDALPVIEGELAWTAVKNDDFRLVTNSLSSWIPLKQQNDQVEARLYRETAPLLVLGEYWNQLTGKRPFWELARKYLLKNQPHDSICGCSVDAVHRNMPYRWAQAEEIADALWADLSGKLATGSEDEGMTVLLPHTDVHVKDGVVTFDIDLPRGWKPTWADNTGYRQVCLFTLLDEKGGEIPYQILRIDRTHERYEAQRTIPVQRYTVAAKAKLRPCGITAIRVVPGQTRSLTPPASPMGLPKVENEFLALTIEPDGTLTVMDKSTAQTYRDLLMFAEEGDCGNGWFYGEVDPDNPVTLTRGGTAKIQQLQNGPLVYTFRITKTIPVPRQLERQNRSAQTTDMTITTDVTLRQGERHIECVTRVDSTDYPADQRMRLLWPTGIPGETYETSQAFCFLTRPRGVSEMGLNGRETEQTEKNIGGIVSVGAAAFVGANGFHEGGVYPDGTISMTFFRRVGQMFHQPKPGLAELPEELCFRYALAFGMDGAALMQLQQDLAGETLAIPVSGRASGRDSMAFVTDARILMSTLKPAEEREGWILRLYNPTADTVAAGLTLAEGLWAAPVTLSEADAAEEMTDTFGPWQIRTYFISKK